MSDSLLFLIHASSKNKKNLSKKSHLLGKDFERVFEKEGKKAVEIESDVRLEGEVESAGKEIKNKSQDEEGFMY